MFRNPPLKEVVSSPREIGLLFADLLSLFLFCKSSAIGTKGSWIQKAQIPRLRKTPRPALTSWSWWKVRPIIGISYSWPHMHSSHHYIHTWPLQQHSSTIPIYRLPDDISQLIIQFIYICTTLPDTVIVAFICWLFPYGACFNITFASEINE